MAAVLIFCSERVQDAVARILDVRWPRSGEEPRRVDRYTIKKWRFGHSRRNGYGCWSTCVRDQLTLEEPARHLSRSFRGPLLLFPFAAGAVVVAPPDVANAYAVQSVGMIGRHLGVTLSPMQQDELHALLFDAQSSGRPVSGPIVGEVPGRAEAMFADRFVEAMRSGRRIPAPDTDLFAAGGSIYFTRGVAAAETNSSSSEGSPQRISATESISAVLRQPEQLAASGGGCSVCYSNRASICLLPCQHQCMCDECARQLCAQSERPACPICRQPASGAVRPFL